MEFFFIVFSLLGLICSFCVITTSNPIYSVFYLILVFCVTTGILLLLTVDFLGAIFIVVYVGAIAVLFLFVVMMLNIKLVQLTERLVGYYPFCIFLLLSFFLHFWFSFNDIALFGSFDILFNDVKIISLVEKSELIFGIATVAYTHYGYAFILSGFVLLLGMVGSICLTLYHSSIVKRQDVYRQVGRNTLSSIYISKL